MSRIAELKALATDNVLGIDILNANKFAELIVRECDQLNRTQSYELSGVVVDTEDGHGFDSM